MIIVSRVELDVTLFRTFVSLIKWDKMAVDITAYVAELSGELSDKAYKASDSLGRIGSEAVVQAMIELLNHPNLESRYMAARTLGLVKNNSEGLVPLLEATQHKDNKAMAGDFLAALEEFDLSANYVVIFKLYLFGSNRVSMIAKNLLDHEEFDITPRVLKKAQKHWNHYTNNVKQDEIYALRKIEVEDMFSDLKDFVDGN